MSRRRVIDTLIVLLILSLAFTVLRYHRSATAQFTSDDSVRDELGRIHDRIVLRAALENVARTKAGYPLAVPTEWFADGLPRNPLVPIEQPWMDIETPGDVSDNPDDPVIYHRGQAGIWYNPELGILRARVMPQFSDTETLMLYNRVNDTAITSLPRAEAPPEDEEAWPEPAVETDPEPTSDAGFDAGSDAQAPDDAGVAQAVAPPDEAPLPAPPTREPAEPDTDAAEPDAAPKRPTLQDHRSQAAD